MKEFLSRHGYEFTVRIVDEDEQAYEELIAMKVRTVPLTLVDGQAILGFDEGKLREALAARS